MAKNIAAGIAGVVIAGVLTMLVEMIGHTIYPPPPDLNYTDMDAMRTYVASLPAGALLSVAIAWTVGAFGGTYMACKIGNAQPLIYACVIGGLILAATAYNLAVIPHPVWLAITGVAGIIGGSWLGMLSGSSETARE